ncbi:MAG TPA: hypothetical protein VK586_00945, partial [Streptosporangiaceae bacterium]|nr:hypothetical protein [Streptosporangiaceae bacterium]
MTDQNATRPAAATLACGHDIYVTPAQEAAGQAYHCGQFRAITRLPGDRAQDWLDTLEATPGPAIETGRPGNGDLAFQVNDRVTVNGRPGRVCGNAEFHNASRVEFDAGESRFHLVPNEEIEREAPARIQQADPPAEPGPAAARRAAAIAELRQVAAGY